MSIDTQTRPHLEQEQQYPDANPDSEIETTRQRQRISSAITSSARNLVRFLLPEVAASHDSTQEVIQHIDTEQSAEITQQEITEQERQQLIDRMTAIIQEEIAKAREKDVEYHSARYHNAVETLKALEHGVQPDKIRLGIIRRKLARNVFDLSVYPTDDLTNSPISEDEQLDS